MLRHALVCLCLALAPAAELRIPAFTAYTLPDPEGAQVSVKHGLTGWTDPAQTVDWYGAFAQKGTLTVRLDLRLPQDAPTKLRLTLAGQSREVALRGNGQLLTADFGSFEIREPGYQRIELASLDPRGAPAGDLDALRLDGPASEGAHFNLKERRNAASVHLQYALPSEAQVQWFYAEVTALEDPAATFYMACGFDRGYFGMQVNSATERRIIFRVWDSGKEAVDRAKVSAEDRVRLVARGPGVEAGDFGNEGTGGHSHLVVDWKSGVAQRFLLGAQVLDATRTVYAGYWWNPETKQWQLISAMQAPRSGGWLRGLHSFSEDFWGSNGNLRRKALYGNQWIRTVEGRWIEITSASFSHDATGKEDRLDRCMGVEDGRFFLAHGGFVEGTTKFGEKFERPAGGQAPDFELPQIPLR